jgi:hypothetical protein
MIKQFLIGLSLLFVISCSKSVSLVVKPTIPVNTVDTSIVKPPIVTDFTTKYGENQNIKLSTILNLRGINPETLKVISINGKFILISTFADLKGTTYDYIRSFAIDTISGILTENTLSLLGEYISVGFPKSPVWYSDLNNDGIKDIFFQTTEKKMKQLMVNIQDMFAII